MGRYVLGCAHLGAPRIHEYRTRFASQQEHDDHIWGLLSELNKRDIVIFLGDVLFSKEALEELTGYPFRKWLVLGNHEFDKGISMEELLGVFERVELQIVKKGMLFTHIPVHVGALRKYRRNVHAHQHTDTIDDIRYINLCFENVDYKLVDLDDVFAGKYDYVKVRP